jgi:hypothetical protein
MNLIHKHECGSTASHQSSRPVGSFLPGNPGVPFASVSFVRRRRRSGNHVGLPAQRNRAVAQDSDVQPKLRIAVGWRAERANAQPCDSHSRNLRRKQNESASISHSRKPALPPRSSRTKPITGTWYGYMPAAEFACFRLDAAPACATSASSTTFVPRIAELHATERTLA